MDTTIMCPHSLTTVTQVCIIPQFTFIALFPALSNLPLLLLTGIHLMIKRLPEANSLALFKYLQDDYSYWGRFLYNEMNIQTTYFISKQIQLLEHWETCCAEFIVKSMNICIYIYVYYVLDHFLTIRWPRNINTCTYLEIKTLFVWHCQ